jgi:hypothetical protein
LISQVLEVREDGDEMKVLAVSTEMLARLLPVIASEDVLQVKDLEISP